MIFKLLKTKYSDQKRGYTNEDITNSDVKWKLLEDENGRIPYAEIAGYFTDSEIRALKHQGIPSV